MVYSQFCDQGLLLELHSIKHKPLASKAKTLTSVLFFWSFSLIANGICYFIGYKQVNYDLKENGIQCIFVFNSTLCLFRHHDLHSY